MLAQGIRVKGIPIRAVDTKIGGGDDEIVAPSRVPCVERRRGGEDVRSSFQYLHGFFEFDGASVESIG